MYQSVQSQLINKDEHIELITKEIAALRNMKQPEQVCERTFNLITDDVSPFKNDIQDIQTRLFNAITERDDATAQLSKANKKIQKLEWELKDSKIKQQRQQQDIAALKMQANLRQQTQDIMFK